MATFHVDASVGTKGKMAGGAVGFEAYLERRNTDRATDALRYIARDGSERDDLVASGSHGLPKWANSAEHFWQQTDRFELKKGVLFRHYQITLPRELSPESQRQLADDIRAAFWEKYPHSWAMHNPPARDQSWAAPGDTIMNPHLHVMFSTRRDDLGRDCGPQAWFKQAARPGQDERSGGVRKDRFWDAKHALQGVRHEVAILINAALEREGIAAAVSPDRVRALGFERSGIHYQQHAGTDAEKEQIRERQGALHKNGTHAFENEALRAMWHEQKQREGIHDVSRETVLAHVRDRFWAQDHTPCRKKEREESAQRSLERERGVEQKHGADAELARVVDRITQRIAERTPERRTGKPLAKGLEKGSRGTEDEFHGGVHVEFKRDMDREIAW